MKPQYQPISDDGREYVFTVFAEDGSSQICKYQCLEGENPDQMMSRVANHHNDELVKAKTTPANVVHEPEPIKDAISEEDLPVLA